MYILGILAPHDEEPVWNDLIDSENESKKNNDDYQVIMEALAEAYSNSHHWSTRRQLLSIVAGDCRFHSIQQFIPDLTLGKFNEARRQAKINGRIEFFFYSDVSFFFHFQRLWNKGRDR